MSGSFFEELKRRRVIRAAGTYIVAAWVLLQLGDVVIEPLGLPEWTQRALIVGLVGFFPVFVVLSWIYDLTWGGLERDPGSFAAKGIRSHPDYDGRVVSCEGRHRNPLGADRNRGMGS